MTNEQSFVFADTFDRVCTQVRTRERTLNSAIVHRPTSAKTPSSTSRSSIGSTMMTSKSGARPEENRFAEKRKSIR